MAPQSESLAHRARGDRAHVHGGARYLHRGRGAAQYCRELVGTIDEATWVLTSYLVANAIVLPASGWFALRFGRRRFLLFCIVVFTISSFFCGAATSLWMILARARGPGSRGGALQPLSQAILLESFPPQKRARPWRSSPWESSSRQSWSHAGRLSDRRILLALGVLHQHSDRRARRIYGFALCRRPTYITSAKPGRFDSIGLGLLVVWLGAMQIVLDKGQEDDWFASRWIRWGVTISVAAFIALLIHQFRDPHPIVNLRVFQGPQFRARLHCDDHVRRRDLWAGGDPAAVLSNRHGLFRAFRRTGRESARHRGDLHHAGGRLPDE
jgi:DHA2 family multidrug resistance protein